MARHIWYEELLYYAEHGVIEMRWVGEKWQLTDIPHFGNSYTEYRIPGMKKLYQARVEIPRPLTAEKAMELDFIYTPSINWDGEARAMKVEHQDNIKFLAKMGLAYRTKEEANKRGEAVLKTEEEK